MAQKLPISPEIKRLILSAENARGLLGSEILVLKQKLDVPARVKGSLTSHPIGWLGGSVVAGLAASLLFRRKEKREKPKKKGLLAFLFTIAFAGARPFLKVWLAGQAKNYIAAKFGSDELTSSPRRRVTPFYQ